MEAELKRMESMGVISKVDEPTPWCAGMVVVPKKQGKVRICVDLKPLNENVLREVHPMPIVDETLAQLTGCSPNSMPTVASGRFLSQSHHNCSQPLSPHSVVTISTNYHLGSPAHQNTSKRECRQSCVA